MSKFHLSAQFLTSFRKTEILLEAALRFKDVSHVFFVQAKDVKSLEYALLEIAGSIGHDILSIRYPHADLPAIWRAQGPEERIRAFKAWLGHQSNQPSLFIVDDLDGFEDESLIKAALPREAHLILYSTRNPSLIRSLERESQQHLIPNMEISEIIPLMLTNLRRSGISNADISNTELEAVAKVVSGNPLAACRAIGYILSVLSHTTDRSPTSLFVTMFSGADWEARLRFLQYKPRIGLSIMDTFAISLARIRRDSTEIRRFLELLAFVSGNDESLDYRTFLALKRPWLKELQFALQDYNIFAKGLLGQAEYLAEIENVSIGVRPGSSGPLQIHPLWRECIQQQAGIDGRVRWLRQILVVCHGSWGHDDKEALNKLRAFVDNAIVVAERFGISLDDIASPQLRIWVNSFKANEDCHSVDIEHQQSSANPAQGIELPQPSSQQGPSAPEESTRELQILEDVTKFKDSCL